MTRSLIIAILIAWCNICFGQNYNIQQNQQNVNINVPVIEKKVYVDRYRTVYVEKPRTDRKLSAPVLLLEYLYVFPEDIGNYQSHPTEIIKAVNRQNLYGRNTWRIPTHDELILMEANADQLGMGDHIYMATSHANGYLRLVSTETNISNNDVVSKGDGFIVGNLIWFTKNFGAKNTVEQGMKVDPHEFGEEMICPAGWRLPTKLEFKLLVMELNTVRGIVVNNSWKWFLTNEKESFALPLYGAWSSFISCAAVRAYDYYLTENGYVKIDVGVTFSQKDTEWINDNVTNTFRYRINSVYNAESLEDGSYTDGYVRCVRDL